MLETVIPLSFADFKANLDTSVLGRLVAELRLAADNCPQCQGSREYVFASRGRENMVPCVRCEPVYALLATLEPILAFIRDESPY
ncbi:MAG TPA: hypothetical protein DCY27_03495 [Desulfobacterales bacterium]|nr:hypothetical protein [Desulfobacterales bacterium]